MKVSKKLTLCEYDEYCQELLLNKIPKWFSPDWRMRVGDCIYDYASIADPVIRKGVHDIEHKAKDLSGLNALISDHFYYFGIKAKPIPDNLKEIVKKNQGHLRITNSAIVNRFESWISRFDKNRLYADPQLRHWFDPEFHQDIGCD